MKIVQAPHPTLKVRSSRVVLWEGQEVVAQLWKAWAVLSEYKVGLAAPQIGINNNAAIVLGDAMLNLWFVPVPFLKEIEPEGCFSIHYASKYFNKARYEYGLAGWTDMQGRRRLEFISGFRARVFQHELDHIKGKLCNEN